MTEEEKLCKVVYELATCVSSDIFVKFDGVSEIELISFGILDTDVLDELQQTLRKYGFEARNVSVEPGAWYVLVRIELGVKE